MTEPAWRTSTYSGSNDNCVEVADNTPRVLVRDTKDHDAGTLNVAPAAWSSFTAYASGLAD
ncbi:DUF397 domain-containing protein [Streptomyces sp. R302]|uniref:DUF397 domain-containing protein n=1 Tax=unclassified Streptomyces TaxID=2593676 RepID=UPI00145F5D67|nr:MULTISPECIES: DUF397 domain-containing protein [unclassified Streptomyces]NML50522.1 DUF397 domain-containing protein [Streptomyces sp. R301]NML79513.1 DUF397 domain-containing protein [Streptomyces sp. R302]